MPSLIDWLVGFAPGLLWLAYFHAKDDHEPEPRRAVLLVYALGCFAAFAVLATRPTLESALLPAAPGLSQHLVDAFAITSLSEEAFKLAALLVALPAWKAWDEPLDGIVYGAAAALGFASVESAWYLALSGEATIVLVRAFTATLVHVGCTAAVGFVIGWARFHNRRSVLLTSLGAFALAVVLHGLYDLFLVAWPEWSAVALLIVLPALLVLLGWATRWARRVSPRFHPMPRPARGDTAGRRAA